MHRLLVSLSLCGLIGGVACPQVSAASIGSAIADIVQLIGDSSTANAVAVAADIETIITAAALNAGGSSAAAAAAAYAGLVPFYAAYCAAIEAASVAAALCPFAVAEYLESMLKFCTETDFTQISVLCTLRNDLVAFEPEPYHGLCHGLAALGSVF
ncbi:hypothetical protein MNV49_002763 [Pseudohyphozyma bogoriensis]|nr:hypothetical protein MNV49_002763 [Pseudohyphozyma bogoriensis]